MEKFFLNKKSYSSGLRHIKKVSELCFSRPSRGLKNLCGAYTIKLSGGTSSLTGRKLNFKKINSKKGNSKAFFFCNKTLNNRLVGSCSITLFYIKNFFNSAYLSMSFNFLTNKFFFKPVSEYQVFGSVTISSLNSSSMDLLEDDSLSLNKFKLGDRVNLNLLEPGFICNTISISSGSKYCRAAGSSATFLEVDDNLNILLLMPSLKIKKFNYFSIATLGVSSNTLYNQHILGKASASIYKNKRQTVRGVAMNSVDHPHGGKNRGGPAWKTPWGLLTKHQKTSKMRKKNKRHG